MIELTSYEDAREGFRSRDLRQALYDEGVRLMDGVIVNLHGDPHIARRRLENRLFRRDMFAWYEADRIPVIIDAVLAGPIADGKGDLLQIARRTMMTLSLDVAGVDLPLGTDDEFEHLYGLMNRLARASTVAHATGDKAAIIADGDEALATFEADFFEPSLQRRQKLIESGEPLRDVLTTLLVNQDQLDLPHDTVLREIAYFPWVGSHSTSGEFVHAMHHMFEWIDAHPDDRSLLMDDAVRRQRFVHESLRLHPASPVAARRSMRAVDLKSGVHIPADEPVTINVEAANRDPVAVGERPAEFDPDRTLADGVPPWGLSFGTGTHACLGQELAGGLEPEDHLDHHLLGAIALMAGAAMAAGARPDPDDPPTLDPNTTRVMWGRYPVVFS